MNEQFLARHWDEIDPLFDAALELDESARAQFLSRECADRPQIRQAVEHLLAAEDRSAQFLSGGYVLDESEFEPELRAGSGGEDGVGSVVGAYKLVRLLGEGGMGAVYLAERADGQYEQQVAIKILHDGVAGKRGNERFVRERQILARFNHPNIARLLDGGVTDDGRPYFAMELIDGEPIDVYCDKNRLPLAGRLQLFQQVCDAVQYAHARFIVHRDLKPANIFVSRAGQVKLLDFGIATPFENGAQDTTLTQSAVMTPSYAAPEQFRGEQVAAATDVYTLGLVLYELLTGQRAHRLEGASPFEFHRVVLETDPDRPSKVVTTEVSAYTSPARIAQARSTAPATLARRLAGDLDAIALKALRKEPEERYASVEAMSRDIEAYLDSRPVDARRGTAVYRFRKVLRRHRVEAISAAVVVLALTGGVVVASNQARIAAEDRDRAQTAQAREAAVNEFLLNDLLRAPSPEFAKGEEISVLEVLDLASKNVSTALREEPVVEASVRGTLAQTYANLGKFDQAIEHARAAHDRLASSVPVDQQALWRSRVLLAELALQKGNYDEAEKGVQQVLVEQRAALGDSHIDTIRTSLLHARVDQMLDRFEAARERVDEEIERLERLHPDRWRVLVDAKSVLAMSLTALDDLDRAETIRREILSLLKNKLGPDHPETGTALLRLGQVLQRKLHYLQAHEIYHELYEQRRRTHGPRHVETIRAMINVAVIAERMERNEEAERLILQAYELARDELGPEHPTTARIVANLGILYKQQARFEEAIPFFRRSIAINAKVYGPDHLRSIGLKADFSVVLDKAGRKTEARRIAKEVMDDLQRVVEKPDVETRALTRFAWHLMETEFEDMRDPHRALPLAEAAVERTHRERLEPLRILAQAQRETGHLNQAIDTLFEAAKTDDAKDSWIYEAQLRNYLVAAERYDEAEQFLLGKLQQRHETRDTDDWLIGRTLVHLAQFYRDRGRHGEAEARFREALDQFRRSLQEIDWRIGRAKAGIGEAMIEQGRIAEAEPFLLEAWESYEADGAMRPEQLERVRDAIVRLYDATDRAADASLWREKTFE